MTTPQPLKTVRSFAGFDTDDDELQNQNDHVLIMPDMISYDKEKMTVTIGPETFRSSNPRLSFAKALYSFDSVELPYHDTSDNVIFANLEPSKVNLGNYCNIGLAGFGYVMDKDGNHIHIPHLGGVTIEEDVFIHNFVNIDRGVIGDTIIRKGCKIDSFTHIAHGVELGANTLVAAHSVIGGSCVIGENCYLGIGCIIKNKVRIGKNSIIGAGCVVLHDVEENSVMVGNPARLLRKNTTDL